MTELSLTHHAAFPRVAHFSVRHCLLQLVCTASDYTSRKLKAGAMCLNTSPPADFWLFKKVGVVQFGAISRELLRPRRRERT